MKHLSFLFILGLMAMASCKNDTASSAVDAAANAVTTPSVPAATSPTAAAPGGEEPAVPAGPITSIEFTDTEHDFGTIMEGEKVNRTFKFTNTGQEPLIISNAKATCGCTVPSWPRDPIAPGESSEIEVQFDSKNKGKVGGQIQSKRITITANTDPVNSYVTIKGTVDKEAGAEVAAPAN